MVCFVIPALLPKLSPIQTSSQSNPNIAFDKVETFVRMLACGAPEYGIHVNLEKAQSNLAPSAAASSVPASAGATPSRASTAGRYIRWCGLLLDTEHAELRADFSNIGRHIRHSMTLNFHNVDVMMKRLRTWAGVASEGKVSVQ